MVRKLALICTLLTGFAASVTAEEVDLQQQRREDQTVNAVPGHKIDHKGIIINPTPQQLILDKRGRFLDLNKKSLKVTKKHGEKVAAKAGVKPVEGAYRLVIDNNGVTITGYDAVGEFYGLKTCEAIMKSPVAAGGKLPYLEINDWPELPVRGVVEGYYGKPWSHEARLALIDFFGRNKLNTYIYGPKNDPYHTSPNWRKPYPEADAAHLAQLIKASDDACVKFTWAVHPGADIKWTDGDFNDIMAKFNQLYDLGCRSFAIFFDDIKGEGTNPQKQVAFLNRLTKEFVEAKGDVTPLAMCPTDFTRAWADGSDNGPLSVYGRTLDPSVMVMWTGDAVCGDIGKETLQWVGSRTKRPALVWWNYPVTDYARHILMQGPVYGLDTGNTSSDLCGLLSNPMENAIASEVAFYGVADYTWNPAAYNAIDSWERSLAELMPECTEAYRDFAINSCDTEFGYRRAESWESPTFPFSDYTPAKAKVLRGQLARMKAAPGIIREKCGNRMLLEEIAPWLDQLTALADRTDRAIELMDTYASGDGSAFWNGYVDNRMDSLQLAAYEAHKIGTFKWQPMYEDLMDKMVDGFYRSLTGEKSSIPEVIGTFGNLQTPSRKKMFDNDTTTVYFADRVQQDGDYIGVEFGAPTELHSIEILQGRDSRDVVVFDEAAVDYSLDGKNWTALMDSLSWVRDIRWNLPKGAQAPMAKFVRLRKLHSDNQQGVGIREFAVNATGITPAFDRNPSTAESFAGKMSFTPAEDVATLCMLFGKFAPGQTVTVSQFDSGGSLLVTNVVNTPYSEIAVAPGASSVAIEGDAEIFEIIPKTTLRVK